MQLYFSQSFGHFQTGFRSMEETLFFKPKRIPESWRISILVFLAGRALFSFWGIVIWYMRLMPTYKGSFYFDIEPVLNGIPGALFGMWQRWDSIHYQSIAASGYNESHITAFYPLYPMLGRLVSWITGTNPLLGLIVVSNVAFLIALWLLHQIVCEEYTPELANNTLFYLIIFPSTFFFYSVYPQSLLLMFILLAYWCSRKGYWVWAGLAGLGAGLTHSTAIVLTLLIGWEAWKTLVQKREGNRITIAIAPFTCVVGIVMFLAWRNMAGFPPYGIMVKDVWGRYTTMPWNGIAAIIRFIITLPLDPQRFLSWINLFIFFIIVGFTFYAFQRIPTAMWFYQAAFLGMIVCIIVDGDPLMGILRYPLVIFPLFIELAMVTNKKSRRLFTFCVFMLLSLILSAWFFMWRFVG